MIYNKKNYRFNFSKKQSIYLGKMPIKGKNWEKEEMGRAFRSQCMSSLWRREVRKEGWVGRIITVAHLCLPRYQPADGRLWAKVGHWTISLPIWKRYSLIPAMIQNWLGRTHEYHDLSATALENSKSSSWDWNSIVVPEQTSVAYFHSHHKQTNKQKREMYLDILVICILCTLLGSQCK